jgi:threonine/homoserine/homoserine lactone efflux protein
VIIEPQQLLVFIAAGWLLNLTPGPDVLYIVSNALKSGVRAGLVASCGIALGCCIHVLAAALGVGALLAASATAFTVIKWVGAAYLLWMGVRLLLARHPDAGGGSTSVLATDQGAAEPRKSLRAVFLGGFWTNVLNPKVVIFFLAFVPQFIAPGTENKTLAFLLLGLLFTLNALPVCAGWAIAAAWMGRRVDALQRGIHWLDRAAGLMFIGFGLKLAVTDSPDA